ncbi:hypothetical protein ACPA9J_00030 [Pseudomonas aeruginosa]
MIRGLGRNAGDPGGIEDYVVEALRGPNAGDITEASHQCADQPSAASSTSATTGRAPGAGRTGRTTSSSARSRQGCSSACTH